MRRKSKEEHETCGGEAGFNKYSLTKKAWESKGGWVDSLVYRKVTDQPLE